MSVTVYPLASREARLAAVDGRGNLSGTADAAVGNNTLANASAEAGFSIGDTITGPQIPAATTIVVLNDSTHSIGMSAAALGNAVAMPIVVHKANPGLNGRSIRLFQSAIALSVNTVLGDLTPHECTFDNYVAVVLAIVFGYVDPSKTPVARSQLVSWLMATAVTPNTVYGWWIDDGVNVIACGTFDAPVGMANVGNELAIVFQDSYPPGSTVIVLGP